jgi:hypothetical protein
MTSVGQLVLKFFKHGNFDREHLISTRHFCKDLKFKKKIKIVAHAIAESQTVTARLRTNVASCSFILTSMIN